MNSTSTLWLIMFLYALLSINFYAIWKSKHTDEDGLGVVEVNPSSTEYRVRSDDEYRIILSLTCDVGHECTCRTISVKNRRAIACVSTNTNQFKAAFWK